MSIFVPKEFDRRYRPLTEETRKKMSKALSGRSWDWNSRIRFSNSRTGIPLSKEHKESISKTLTGRRQSWETRLRRSQSLMGHPVGKETREKISRANQANSEIISKKVSAALTGRKLSEETRRKISEVQIGKVLSKEHRRNISRALRGKSRGPLSKEHKESISRANKARWNNPEFVIKMGKAHNQKPTWDEYLVGIILEKHFPNTWKYTGDRTTGLTVGGKVPDFIHSNGKKIVIEIFGYYWHDPLYFPNKLTEEELKEHYNKFGYRCLVLWDYECQESTVVRKVKEVMAN